MYLMIYEEKVEKLELEKEKLHKKIDQLEKLVEEQEELIYTLKQVYHKTPDDSEGEATDFYNCY